MVANLQLAILPCFVTCCFTHPGPTIPGVVSWILGEENPEEPRTNPMYAGIVGSMST